MEHRCYGHLLGSGADSCSSFLPNLASSASSDASVLRSMLVDGKGNDSKGKISQRRIWPIFSQSVVIFLVTASPFYPAISPQTSPWTRTSCRSCCKVAASRRTLRKSATPRRKRTKAKRFANRLRCRWSRLRSTCPTANFIWPRSPARTSLTPEPGGSSTRNSARYQSCARRRRYVGVTLFLVGEGI